MLDTLKSHCILIYECCKYHFIPKYNFRFVKKKKYLFDNRNRMCLKTIYYISSEIIHL